MKNVLITGAVGVGLLGATIGGLLFAQDRLNYEGTRNIPLLNVLFEPPADREEAGRTPVKAPRTVPHDLHVAGQPAPAVESARPGVGVTTAPGVVREFEPGALLHLRRIESSGVTVDEVNRIVEDCRQQHAQLEAARQALEAQRKELEVREQDLAARQREVESWLAEVVTGRQKLDAAIEDFEKRVLMLPRDEVPGLRAAARTVAKLLPSAAAALLVEFWDHDGSPDRVTKILAVMDPERADEILACLDARRSRELLTRRMQLVRPAAKGARRR